LGQSPFLPIRLTIKVLPKRSQVYVKSCINVVEKMDYRRRDIYMAIDSDVEHTWRRKPCFGDPDTVDWIETFNEGDVFFDVGANVGALSLITSKFFDGKVRAYSFEPAFFNFAQLCKNVTLNSCQKTAQETADQSS